MKHRKEKLRQISNIWAMVAAAGYADAFFHGEWFWGFALGTFAVRMCFYAIDLSKEGQK